jgi:hypothetical protein
VPAISSFYGIVIRMFFSDREPPHFHAQYAGFKATIDIATLQVLRGELPRRAQNLVIDWAEHHQAELLRNWYLCKARRQPEPVAPLG